MTQDNTSRPVARKIDLVTREMPDEVLVYDLKTHQAHCLNQTAALVWKYCDGKNSVTDIAELVALETNTSVDEAAVWLALERLGKANLLEERVLPPIGSPRLSRRETVKRLGLGFALAVPVVMSVVAPAAAAAASGCAAQLGAPNCLSNTGNWNNSGGGASQCSACVGVTGTCYTAVGCTGSTTATNTACQSCPNATSSWKPN